MIDYDTQRINDYDDFNPNEFNEDGKHIAYNMITPQDENSVLSRGDLYEDGRYLTENVFTPIDPILTHCPTNNCSFNGGYTTQTESIEMYQTFYFPCDASSSTSDYNPSIIDNCNSIYGL